MSPPLAATVETRMSARLPSPLAPPRPIRERIVRGPVSNCGSMVRPDSLVAGEPRAPDRGSRSTARRSHGPIRPGPFRGGDPAGAATGDPVRTAVTLQAGDTLRTGEHNSEATLVLSDGTILSVGELATVEIQKADASVMVNLVQGILSFSTEIVREASGSARHHRGHCTWHRVCSLQPHRTTEL